MFIGNIFLRIIVTTELNYVKKKKKQKHKYPRDNKRPNLQAHLNYYLNNKLLTSLIWLSIKSVFFHFQVDWLQW